MDMEESKRHSFDAYCKRLVKNEALDIQREYARQGEHEVAFSELTQQDWQRLRYMDRHSSDLETFAVLNTTVEIENENLGRALAALSPERRIIILSAYLLDMSDDEIAKQLQLCRSTVQYRRTSILKELRKLLEEYKYE